ncbi:MAG: hypothetical protein HY234_15425 [Acidobacteria bacterium]|nr:hypothetical protein [Acidobacteriota bacterium]
MLCNVERKHVSHRLLKPSRTFQVHARHALLLTALLLPAVSASVAEAQVSPGPLSKAHQSLSGPTLCTTCHKLGAGAATFKCLNCHTLIAQRLNEGRGLHATLVPKGATSEACVSCHSEHNGEDFNLLKWDPTPRGFDHAKTGYTLEGKHSGLDCKRCHTPEHMTEAERHLIGEKLLPRTFLGLSRDCLTCHADAHRGQLGRDCQRCHNFDGWKTLGRFTHAKTRFPLTGRHEQVACQKCHPPSAGVEKVVQFTGIAFDKCTACHADPHRGAFAAACQICHTTSGWKAVSVAGKFDHSKTNYPLAGKHAAVQCSQCHRTADFKKPLAHQKCADCHTPDPHGGQFMKRADGTDCAACHSLDGFKPAKFGVKEHATALYPLEGKHAAVACTKCHVPAGKATIYKVKFALCTDCHSDVHKKQFAGAPYQNRCENCHTVQGYRPSTFNIARHQKSRFALSGGHIAVACMECHPATTTNAPAPPIPYRFEDRSCSACHTNPHRGQFRERMTKRIADGSPAGCEACHSTKVWKDLARFDHAATSYPLVGAHRAVPCLGCHRPPNLETTLKNVEFRSAPSRCEGCHVDPHGGQFSSVGKPPACAECHTVAKWKPSLFDHDKRTTFLLQGGHKDVACSACHKLTKTVEERSVLFYKPTPKECKACHEVVKRL